MTLTQTELCEAGCWWHRVGRFCHCRGGRE